MANATSFNPCATEMAAWWGLSKQEQEVIAEYNRALQEDHVEIMLILEVLYIQSKHPGLCPVLSIPARFLCS